MGRNPLERGGISADWIVRGNMESKMGGVGFALAPLLGQYLSIRDTGIFGYPHKRNLRGDGRVRWRHA
jgi:hypothetical protein